MKLLRPNLTEYRIYIEVLLDRLNQDSVYKMGVTDLIKLLIEKAMKEYCPDVVIKPKRKRYETWRFLINKKMYIQVKH